VAEVLLHARLAVTRFTLAHHLESAYAFVAVSIFHHSVKERGGFAGSVTDNHAVAGLYMRYGFVGRSEFLLINIFPIHF
jgi:hypothetical protein